MKYYADGKGHFQVKLGLYDFRTEKLTTATFLCIP